MKEIIIIIVITVIVIIKSELPALKRKTQTLAPTGDHEHAQRGRKPVSWTRPHARSRQKASNSSFQN